MSQHILFIPGFTCIKNPDSIPVLAKRYAKIITPESHIIGWSFGGLIALEMTKTIQVKSLTLLACSPKFVETHNWPGIGKAQAKAFLIKMKRNPRQCIHDFRKHIGLKPIHTQHHIEGEYRFLSSALQSDYRHCIPNYCQWVLGENDDIIPACTGQYLENAEILKETQHTDFYQAMIHLPLMHYLRAFTRLKTHNPSNVQKNLSASSCHSWQPKNEKMIQKNFGCAAQSYLNYNQVQQHIFLKLKKLIDPYLTPKMTILDCGAGQFPSYQYFPSQSVIALDFACTTLNHPDMIQADFNQIPLCDHSLDVIFSNMALHWSSDIFKTLMHWKRKLHPRRYLAISIPTTGTFHSFHQLLSEKNIPLPFRFHTPKEILDMLEIAGLSILNLSKDGHNIHFQSITEAMGYLKKTGVRYAQHRLRFNQAKQLLKHTGGITFEFETTLIVACVKPNSNENHDEKTFCHRD